MNLPAPQLEVITSKAARPAEGGSVDALVSVRVDFPPIDVDRRPLNLALVIDRSGSMNGHPLEAAKQAAQTAVGMLMPGDYVSVVTFGSVVEVPVPLEKVTDDRAAILARIAHITTGGMTDLYGGWAEGLSQVMGCPESDVVSRVVVLSDGGANLGVSDAGGIATDVAGAVTHNVTTTALGLGLHYNEALLRAIADAGNGNYEFLEGHEAVVEAFEQELAGLGALRGRDVTLAATSEGVRLQLNALNVVSVPQGAAARRDTTGIIRLPDLVAGLPTEVLVTMTFAANAAEPGLTLRWTDAITGSVDQVSTPVDLPAVDGDAFANLNVDERVSAQLTTLQIAHAKLAASHAARTGDTTGARERLDVIAGLISEMPAGEARDQETSELAELRRRVEMEGARMARYSEKLARARFTNRREEDLKKMASAESEFRRFKLDHAAKEPTATRFPFGAQHRHRVEAPSSSTDASEGRRISRELIERRGRPPLRLEIVIGDITKQRVDAIVNSSNRGLFGTSGVDGAIHRRAGPALKAATEAIGSIAYGEAVVTRGFDLPAQYVIHTATPSWGETGRELQLLARCYDSALSVADRLGVKSVALPAIGTGAYGYPIQEATHVAAMAVSPWLTRSAFEEVRFVLLDMEVVKAYMAELAAWRGTPAVT